MKKEKRMSEFVRIALIAIAGCLVLAGVTDAAIGQYRRASRRDDARS